MAIVSNNSINTISPNTGFGSVKDTLQSLYGEISRLQQAAYMRGINGKSVESKVMTFLDILNELGLAKTPVEAQKYITNLFNIQANEWNIDVENFWGSAKNDGVLYYKFNVFTVDNKITVTPFMIYIDPRLSSVSSYTGEKDFNDTSCMLEIVAKDSGYTIKANYLMPRLYWNKDVKAFCWNINGKQTSISAQGINGKDGANGNLKKCILATRVDTGTNEGWYVKSDSSITVDKNEINNAIFRVSSNSSNSDNAYSSVSVDDNSLSVGLTVIACQYKLIDETETKVKVNDYDSSGFKLADNSKTVVLDDIIFGTVGTKEGHYVVNGADTSFKSLITSSGGSDPFAQIEFSTVGTGGTADTNPIQHVHIKSGKDVNQHRLVSFKNSNNEDENGQPNLTTLSLVYATSETPKKIYSTPYEVSVSSFASTTKSVFDIYNYNVNIESAKVKFKEDGSYFGNKVVLNADSNNKLFLNGFSSYSTMGIGNAKVVSNSCNTGRFIYSGGKASSTNGHPTIVWRRGISDNYSDNYGARIDFGFYSDYGTYLSLGVTPSSSTNTFKKVAVFGEKYSYIGCYNPSTGDDNYLSITSKSCSIVKKVKDGVTDGESKIYFGNEDNDRDPWNDGINIYSLNNINIKTRNKAVTLRSSENEIRVNAATSNTHGGIIFTKKDENNVYGTEFNGTNVYIKGVGGYGGNLKVDKNLIVGTNLSITSKSCSIVKKVNDGANDGVSKIYFGNEDNDGDPWNDGINIYSLNNINIKTRNKAVTLGSSGNQILVNAATSTTPRGIIFTKKDKYAYVYGTEFNGTNVHIKNTDGFGGNLKVDGDLNAGGNLLFTNGGFISFNGIRQRSLINKIIIRSQELDNAKLIVSKYFNDNGSKIKISPHNVMQSNGDIKGFSFLNNAENFYTFFKNNKIMLKSNAYGQNKNWSSDNKGIISIASIKIENTSDYDLVAYLLDNTLFDRSSEITAAWTFGALSVASLSANTNISSISNLKFYSNDIFTIPKKTTMYLFLKVMRLDNAAISVGNFYDCELEFYI